MGVFTYEPDTGNTTPAGHPGPDASPPQHQSPNTAMWTLDATTIKSLNQSENSSLQPGDELYLARVLFRSTVGEAASTTAHFNGGVSRDTTIKHLQVGESVGIPDAMGRVLFPDVTLRSFEDILAGRGPEIIGTVDVLFEDDNTAKSAIANLMDDLAVAVDHELAEIIEPLDLLHLDQEAVAEQLDHAVKRIQDSVLPEVGRQITLFLASFFNPDDRIGFQASMFFAVDDAMAPIIDALVADAVPPDVGIARALAARSYDQTYKGSGGRWKISHRVSS